MKLITPLMILFLPLLCMGQEMIAYQSGPSQINHENGVRSIEFVLPYNFTSSIINNKSQVNLIALPFFNGQILNLKVTEVTLFAGTPMLVERRHSGNRNLQFPEFKAYRGHVAGNENSNVSLTVFKNEISGVINIGNASYTLGKQVGTDRHLITDMQSANAVPEFQCNTIGESSKPKRKESNLKSSGDCLEPVEIYLECDYHMFQSFGNIDAASSYVTSLFNELSAIYANESVNLLLTQIAIWSEDDNYADNTNGILDFGDDMLLNGFPGDFAHLLTNDPGGNGGIAYIDMFCGATPFGYSDIINTNNPYPTYSWDVQVVAHELGHNFGSQHTHDCVWGPNGDEQIDDCGNVEFGGDACYDAANPIIPANGGTIMSYCHLNAVGINFSEGLGQEPGDLIRQKLADCKCDNATCVTAKEVSGPGVYSAQPDHGNGATSPNANHANWFYYIAPEDGSIDINSCGGNSDTRIWIYTGDCGSLVFNVISDDDCDMGNGDDYASAIIDFQVTAGIKYYFEWDDRWSESAFDWQFGFTPDSTMDPCDALNIMASGTIIDSVYNAKIGIESDGIILSGESVMFKAGQEIELLSGFEIQMGATLESIIEDCEM